MPGKMARFMINDSSVLKTSIFDLLHLVLSGFRIVLINCLHVIKPTPRFQFGILFSIQTPFLFRFITLCVNKVLDAKNHSIDLSAITGLLNVGLNLKKYER